MADNFTPTPIKGLKTNNSSAPTNDNAAVLPAVATAAIPSYVEGNEVKNSTDLHGSQRVTLLDPNGVATATDANPLIVQVDETPAGTNILSAKDTGGDVAAGATADIDSDAITDGSTAYLNKITVSSSVRIKVEVIGLGPAGAEETFAVLFVNDTHFGTWGPSVPSTTASIGNATGDTGYRLKVTNMDNLLAAPIYATFEYSEK